MAVRHLAGRRWHHGGMTDLDVQFFQTAPGRWIKPEGAVSVDVILKGGDGMRGATNVTWVTIGAGSGSRSEPAVSYGVGGTAISVAGDGGASGSSPAPVANGAGGGGSSALCPAAAASTPDPSVIPGKITALSFAASDLPDTIEVGLSGGYAPGGGFAMIITHLEGA